MSINTNEKGKKEKYKLCSACGAPENRWGPNCKDETVPTSINKTRKIKKLTNEDGLSHTIETISPEGYDEQMDIIGKINSLCDWAYRIEKKQNEIIDFINQNNKLT